MANSTKTNHVKIKKIITSLVFVSVVSLTALVNVAPAHASENPWHEVWAAINELREAVANINSIPGQQGEQGLQGPAGIFPSVYTKKNTVVVPPYSEQPGTTSNTVYCDEGDTILSGGWRMNYVPFDVFQNNELFPTYEYNAWIVSVANKNEVPKELTVSIRCANTNPN